MEHRGTPVSGGKNEDRVEGTTLRALELGLSELRRGEQE